MLCSYIFHSIYVGLLAMPLHFAYPLTKRWLWWPQAWLGSVILFSEISLLVLTPLLGISNSTSFLVGWFAVAGDRERWTHIETALIMYVGLVWYVFNSPV
jgi:4-hydroxybenzoate polyprenyltransferase